MIDRVILELAKHQVLLDEAYTAFKWERERLNRSQANGQEIDVRLYYVAKANLDLALRGIERFAHTGIDLLKDLK